MASYQAPTQLLSLPLLISGKDKMEKLVGQDKVREMIYKLVSQRNRLFLGKIIYYQIELHSEK